MKRVLLLVLILGLLLVPPALAVKEAKASGWYSYVDSFTFNGADYTLKLMGGEYIPGDDEQNAEGGTLRVGKDDEKVIVSLGSCHENINHSYCFFNKSFEREEVEIDSEGRLQPAIEIEFTEYDYSSDVTVKRTFEKIKFALYEAGEVNVVIENTGDHPMMNIRLSEVMPEGFEVAWHQSDVLQVENELKATFNLYPGNTWSTKYRVKGVAYNKSSYKTTILYDAEDGINLEKESTSATLEVLQPYTVAVKLPTKVERDELAEFTITITNNENEELNIDNMRVYIPLSLGISGKTGLNLYAYNVLGYEGALDPKEVKNFVVRLNTPFVGSYSIVYKGDIEVKDETYNFSGVKDMAVTTMGMNCYFTFNQPTLQAGRNLQYTVVLENLGNLDDYYSINGTIHTPFEDIPFFIPSLFRNDFETVINKRYQMEFSKEDKEYPFSIEATYRTEAGQEFSCEEENDYLVKGAENVLDFDIFISADKPSPGDDVNLIVTVGNELAEDIYDITLFSNTTDGEIVQGIREKQIGFLASQEKEEMYTITVHIPEDYEKDKLEVLTTGIVDSHGYTDIESTIIPIKLPEPEEEVKEDVKEEVEEKPVEKPTTQPVDEKEEFEGSFLAKVWNFIKKLW